MNILQIGNGKMGKTINSYLTNNGFTIIDILDENNENYIKKDTIHIIIDFSSTNALSKSLNLAIKFNVPLIIGTTGYNTDELSLIQSTSKIIPIFLESNFSLIMHKFIKLKKYLSKDYTIKKTYLIETHHQNKLDAPSGTAKKLKNENDIVISLRGGSIYGEHQIRYIYENEEITLTHRAENRCAFISGLIPAIDFITKQENGLFDLNSIEDNNL